MNVPGWLLDDPRRFYRSNIASFHLSQAKMRRSNNQRNSVQVSKLPADSQDSVNKLASVEDLWFSLCCMDCRCSNRNYRAPRQFRIL